MKAIILEYRVEDVRRHGLPRDRYLVLTENESDEAVEEHRLPGFRAGRALRVRDRFELRPAAGLAAV